MLGDAGDEGLKLRIAAGKHEQRAPSLSGRRRRLVDDDVAHLGGNEWAHQQMTVALHKQDGIAHRR